MTQANVITRLIDALGRVGGEHSSVRLTRNSRGDVQVEVACRTGEQGVETVEQARVKAQQQFDLLCQLYPMQTAGGGNGGS